MSIFTRGRVNIDWQYESRWLHVRISVYLTTLCELLDLDIFSIAWQDTREECGGREAIAVFIYHNGWQKTKEITTGMCHSQGDVWTWVFRLWSGVTNRYPGTSGMRLANTNLLTMKDLVLNIALPRLFWVNIALPRLFWVNIALPRLFWVNIALPRLFWVNIALLRLFWVNL